MGWVEVDLPPGLTRAQAQATGAQLLPDGRVLVVGTRDRVDAATSNYVGAWVLTPRASDGSYRYGTWTEAAVAPATSLYQSVTILNDGRVIYHPGEYYEGTDRTVIYNGAGNEWSEVADQLRFTAGDEGGGQSTIVSEHLHVSLLPDGRMAACSHAHSTGGRADYTSDWKIMAADAASVTTITASGAGAGLYGNENGGCLLPDDRVFWIVNGPGHREWFHATADYGGANFSRHDPTTDEFTHASQVLPTSWDTKTGDPQWVTTFAYGGDRFASVHPDVYYEVGPLLYTPKSDRVVLVDGNGRIWDFNPDLWTTTFEVQNHWVRRATLGCCNDTYRAVGTPAAGQTNTRGWGSIGAPVTGATQTMSDHQAVGHLDVVIDGAYNAAGRVNANILGTTWNGNARFPAFYVILPNGRFARVTYNTAAIQAGDLDSGQDITIRFITLADGSGAATAAERSLAPGDWATAFGTGSRVSFVRPFWTARDAPGVVLPNGDVLVWAGVASLADAATNGGFNDVHTTFSWDPVTFALTARGGLPGNDYMGAEANSNGEFTAKPVLLPSGEVFCVNSGHGWHLYEPTTVELTPDPSWKPTITSTVADVLRPGETFTLTGTQLTGLHEGGYFGDDQTSRSNFPIPRFTNRQTGEVHYGRSFNYTYRGIKPGQASSCSVHVPADMPPGNYDLAIVTNGIASDPAQVWVLGGADGGVFFNQFALD